MSIEALLAEQTAAIREQTNAIVENTAAVLKLHAGREEALEQLSKVAAGGGEPAKTTRTRKAKTAESGAATTGGGEAPAEQGAGQSAPETQRRAIDTSDAGLRALLGGWLRGSTEQPIPQEESAKRAAQVAAMLQHFGSPAVAGDKSTLDDDQRYQAVFFIERMIAGQPVDFNADYDFDGDPLFDKPAAAADDLLG